MHFFEVWYYLPLISLKEYIKINIEKIKYFLSQRKIKNGNNIYLLTYDVPILFVFLRQLGCAFTHKTLLELRVLRSQIESEGVLISLVHMAPIEEAEQIFSAYHLKGLLNIYDPEYDFYKAMGLKCGTVEEIYSPDIWMVDDAKELSTDEIDPILGNPLQMPGVFLVYEGKVLKSFIHKKINEKPSYLELIEMPIKELSLY